MSHIDRTKEFFLIVESLRRDNPGLPTAAADTVRPHLPPAPGLPGDGRGESFNSSAALIGNKLTATRLKLTELNALAKQRQIFNDKTSEIDHLTVEIKQNLTEVNHAIETLVQQAGEGSRYHGDRHHRAHFSNVTDTLRGRFLELTKEFKDILELRTRNMREQDARRNLYSSAAQYDTGGSSSLPAFDLESGGIRAQVQTVAPRSLYSRSREEAVDQVQRMIAELGQIFGRVATLVSHHDEMIRRIDDDVDRSLHNVKEGEAHLLKYFHTISSNRTLILKVFAIIFLFIVFFVLFLA